MLKCQHNMVGKFMFANDVLCWSKIKTLFV